jgi:hypothetical protein
MASKVFRMTPSARSQMSSRPSEGQTLRRKFTRHASRQKRRRLCWICESGRSVKRRHAASLAATVESAQSRVNCGEPGFDRGQPRTSTPEPSTKGMIGSPKRGSEASKRSSDRGSGAPGPQRCVFWVSITLPTAARRGTKCRIHSRRLARSPINVPSSRYQKWANVLGQLRRASCIAREKNNGLRGALAGHLPSL